MKLSQNQAMCPAYWTRLPRSIVLVLKVRKVGERVVTAAFGVWSAAVVRALGWAGLFSNPPLMSPPMLKYLRALSPSDWRNGRVFRAKKTSLSLLKSPNDR